MRFMRNRCRRRLGTRAISTEVRMQIIPATTKVPDFSDGKARVKPMSERGPRPSITGAMAKADARFAARIFRNRCLFLARSEFDLTFEFMGGLTRDYAARAFV